MKKTESHQWLKEVSNISLAHVCRDLGGAYEMYYKKACSLPKFKSKKRLKAAFPVRHNKVKFHNGYVHIEKIGKVKYRYDYPFSIEECIKLSNTRIKLVNNKWILTAGIERENQAPQLTDKKMGIDLGIKTTATVAFGNDSIVFRNINKTARIKKLEQKLKHIQRTICRKRRMNSGNLNTNAMMYYEEMARKTYYKIACIRKDYIHKTTCSLTGLLPATIVMEDLNVDGMMKNHHLAKSVQDQMFFEFKRQMRYKCKKLSIKLIEADRFYASSKTCSVCGEKKQDLKLSERVFVCPHCGARLDRDYNAAVNLMRYVDSE